MKKVVTIVALVLSLALAAPAGAHTERQLHAALKALKKTNAKQSAQIKAQARRISTLESFVLLHECGISILLNGDKLTWDTLNESGVSGIAGGFPSVDEVDESICEVVLARTTTAERSLQQAASAPPLRIALLDRPERLH